MIAAAERGVTGGDDGTESWHSSELVVLILIKR